MAVWESWSTLVGEQEGRKVCEVEMWSSTGDGKIHVIQDEMGTRLGSKSVRRIQKKGKSKEEVKSLHGKAHAALPCVLEPCGVEMDVRSRNQGVDRDCHWREETEALHAY